MNTLYNPYLNANDLSDGVEDLPVVFDHSDVVPVHDSHDDGAHVGLGRIYGLVCSKIRTIEI